VADRAQAAVELVVDVLRRGRAQFVIARGGSMTAAIRDGARVGLAPLRDRRGRVVRRPKLGEVVAVASPRVGFVVHRVVGVDSAGRLLVKGDANPAPDGWFDLEEIAAIADDVDGAPVSPPRSPPPRWRRGLMRLAALLWR
jgi:hypothetical protein